MQPEVTPFEQERQRIIEALKEVYDPEIPVSIVDLGLIRKIEEVGAEIHITMILTSPRCPLADFILEEARQAAQAVTNWTVLVQKGTEQWDHSMMAQPTT
jgi:metal-sulfur cluster biosynthetic enzyme